MIASARWCLFRIEQLTGHYAGYRVRGLREIFSDFEEKAYE
jgi:hypothetical protein